MNIVFWSEILSITAPVTSVLLTPANSQIDLTENTAVQFTCTTSTARPAASVNRYIYPNGNSYDITRITDNITTTTDYNVLSVITSTLHFVPTRQHNDMKIYCTANNSVNTSPVKSNKILLNVQYEANVTSFTINGIANTIVTKNEGDSVHLICNADSNPIASITLSHDDKSLKTEISNIMKHDISQAGCLDAGKYVCYAKNEYNTIFNVSEEVQLFVNCYPRTANKIRSNITSEMNAKIKITLNVIAYPPPTFTWYKLVDEEWTLLNDDVNYALKSSAVQSNLTIRSVGTSDFTSYKVHTKNDFGEMDQLYYLFPYGYPRTANVIRSNITSEMNATITVTLNVIAYPPPTFIWYKLVDEEWTLLNDDDNYSLKSSALQSNLTIRSVGTSDFTSYKVHTKNEFGEMDQLYYLFPYDKPDPLINFTHIESRTTTSSIHLVWTPGFNNGSPQTFNIEYRKSTDNVWNYRNVSDNGESTMDLLLTGLTENTQYDFVIFASNGKGNSSELSLTAATIKGIEKSPTNPALLIGGIACGVIGCIILVIVIIFITRRYPLYKVCSEKLAQEERCY